MWKTRWHWWREAIRVKLGVWNTRTSARKKNRAYVLKAKINVLSPYNFESFHAFFPCCPFVSVPFRTFLCFVLYCQVWFFSLTFLFPSMLFFRDIFLHALFRVAFVSFLEVSHRHFLNPSVSILLAIFVSFHALFWRRALFLSVSFPRAVFVYSPCPSSVPFCNAPFFRAVFISLHAMSPCHFCIFHALLLCHVCTFLCPFLSGSMPYYIPCRVSEPSSNIHVLWYH